MKLAYWMYAGPAHIGVLRVTSSFKNVHAIMHAPLGDDYFNVMRSMLERERDFTPVTASIVDRHVLARGSQEKVVENIIRKNKEESPDLILLTPTCTSSILQEDLHNFVERSTLSLTGGTTNENLSTLPVPQNQVLFTQPEPFSSFSSVDSSKPTLLTPDSGALIKLKIRRLTDVETHLEQHSSSLMSSSAEATVKCKNKNGFTKNFVENFLTSQQFEKPQLELDSTQFYLLHEIKNKKYLSSKNLFLSSQINKIKNINNQVNGADCDPESNVVQSSIRKEIGKNQKINVQNSSCEKIKFDKNFFSSQSPDVILADVNHYRVNELQAADRTLEQIVRFYIEKAKKQNNLNIFKTEKPSVNIIGIFTLGFHNQHDCRELKRLFNDLGITINEIIPEGGNVNNLKNLPKAWFNFVPYREVGLMTAIYLKSEFNMPYVSITPMGLVDTALCIREIGQIISKQLTFSVFSTPFSDVTNNKKKKNIIENLFNKYIDQQTRFVSQAAWFSRSIDCQNLTGKKAVVFGDATHAAAMTKILAREMGIRVSCAGTYCKHDADWFREQVTGFCDQILITDDHTQVGDTIAKLEPAAIFGTQMERHVGKRLDIPCGVISAPVHIQNFPLGYRPFLGYEGTNQIADLVYNSFNLGMEDHLLQIFGGHDSIVPETNSSDLNTVQVKDTDTTKSVSKVRTDFWSPESLAELNKVPGFVRGKVKRNTEKYALQNNIPVITVEVMYAAKEALSS